MNQFSLKIIASDKVFFDGNCGSIIIPAMDGEVEIQAHHENMVIATDVGETRFKVDENSDWQKVVTGLGFIHIANNCVTMLVDTAEKPEDIDTLRAKLALERAEEELRQEQSIQEYKVSRASLARAMVRLKEAGKVNNLYH